MSTRTTRRITRVIPGVNRNFQSTLSKKQSKSSKEEEEESEDELLLTTKTNKQLQKEITIQQTKKKTFKECKICAFS